MPTPMSLFNQKSATDPGGTQFNFVAVSGTPTVYSVMFSGEDSPGGGGAIFTTGTLTGTFTLWVTDKITPSEADDTDWVQDTAFTPTNPAGAPAKFAFDTSNLKAYRKRLKYVNASGTGNVQGFLAVVKTHY